MKLSFKAWPILMATWSMCIFMFYMYDSKLINGYLFLWVQGLNATTALVIFIKWMITAQFNPVLYEFSLGQKATGKGHLSISKD